MRGVLILILVGAVVAVVKYRTPIFNQVNKILALNKEEEPIPVLSLEKGPLQLEVQANGEIVGLGSVPVATPSTRNSRGRSSWRGWSVRGPWWSRGNSLIRFDNTDTLLQLEQQNNTLTQSGLQNKVETGSPAVERAFHGHRPPDRGHGLRLYDENQAGRSDDLLPVGNHQRQAECGFRQIEDRKPGREIHACRNGPTGPSSRWPPSTEPARKPKSPLSSRRCPSWKFRLRPAAWLSTGANAEKIRRSATAARPGR